LIKVFPKEIIKLFKQQTIHSSRYGILEVYTRQILINYIGQVFEGPVRIVIYTNSTSVEGNQIELLVEMYQTTASKEKLSNRMIVTLGKPISATVIKESLKEFTFLQRKEKYDLVNLSYNSQGNMTIAAILDNLQNELGLAMEWITGVFFYRMKVVLKKAIMVRRAHYLFTGTPIREPWNKKGFIIDTYVKSGYKDAGIRLEFLQVIYRERTIKGNKILSLVGVGFREIVFVDLKSKRPVSMQFASLEDILRLQKKKKKEAEQRLRVQESVEKALKLKPKGFWEAIWPETWLKSWFKKE